MNKKMVFLMMFLNIWVQHTEARDGTAPELTPVNASDLYVPNGFDSNDNIQVVIEGYFPNTCYKIGPTVVKKENNDMVLQPFAYYYPGGVCLQVLVHYEEVVDIGIAEKGTYKISVGKGGISKTLTIKQATNEGPDDYTYAPVKTANFISSDEKIVRLEGVFLNDCMNLKKEDIIIHEPHDHVVAILPVADHRSHGEPCKKGHFPFKVEVSLKNKNMEGRHLIHVRALNGKSVNLIEDF